ncbi:polyadenylate-binding protein 4-like [Trichonephila clavata]|uniref:Polyadenylate-binding protein 4-like n=1 Tax=Trichonephila clavata TaxID=2740835 RepID=A0A8X6HUQ9_TRICU|nr:polyadenylate-binding protein 4-like [Trichonephila clavata]
MTTTILIENLYPSIDVSNLCELFGKYGRILSASIEFDPNLVSLGKGRVCYDNASSAHCAVKEMNGRKHLGKAVYVKVQSNLYDPTEISQIEPFKQIFVKNIDLTWDDYDLIGQFGRFGEIEDVKISDTNGRSNGYGFVKFQKHSSAKTAVEVMHNKIINGRKIFVQPFTYKPPNEIIKPPPPPPLYYVDNAPKQFSQMNNLFIKNLPKDLFEDELSNLFKKFGAIQSVKVATDKAHKSKGYGFVCFYNEKVAAKARDQMNGVSYKSKILEVDFYRNNNKPLRDQFMPPNHSYPKMKAFEDQFKTGRSAFLGDKNTLFSFTAKR